MTGLRANAVGVVPVAYPATIAPWVIYAWVAAGLAVLGYFLVRDRSRLAQSRELFTQAVGGGHEQPQDADARQC